MTERELEVADYWLPLAAIVIGGILIAIGAAIKGEGFAKNGVSFPRGIP